MIRTILTAVVFILPFCSVFAQDRVITKDGDVFEAYRIDIGSTYVYYTKEDKEDAPLQKIIKADVLMIKKQDGTKIDITEYVPSSAQTSQNAQRENDVKQSITQVKPEDLSVEAKAANDALIAKYNQTYDTNIGTYKKNGSAKSAYMRLGVTEESVLENDDIAIMMETGFLWKEKKDALWQLSYNTIWNNLSNVGIRFKISNKTNNTLYLDLGNTFYVSMGQSFCYYMPTSTTTTNSSYSGIGVNAGAVTNALGIGGV